MKTTSAIGICAAMACLAAGEGVEMTQAEMNIQAAKDSEAAISELGRTTAMLAFAAPTAAESDRILGEFRRTMELCMEERRRPIGPDSGSIAPLPASGALIRVFLQSAGPPAPSCQRRRRKAPYERRAFQAAS